MIKQYSKKLGRDPLKRRVDSTRRLTQHEEEVEACAERIASLMGPVNLKVIDNVARLMGVECPVSELADAVRLKGKQVVMKWE